MLLLFLPSPRIIMFFPPADLGYINAWFPFFDSPTCQDPPCPPLCQAPVLWVLPQRPVFWLHCEIGARTIFSWAGCGGPNWRISQSGGSQEAVVVESGGWCWWVSCLCLLITSLCMPQMQPAASNKQKPKPHHSALAITGRQIGLVVWDNIKLSLSSMMEAQALYWVIVTETDTNSLSEI